MPCFSPLSAFQTTSGEIIFAERKGVARSLKLPCGQCIGCRLERSRQWAVRCMHEAATHKKNCFVTLTYNDEHLPFDGGLQYREFQLFMKRLRKTYGRVRFYMCGEYGDQNGRPHFHACLFGLDFPDKVIYKELPSGACLYTSESLSKLWPKGYASVGDVTFESAAYVARYVMKKVTGVNAPAHYTRLIPETGELVEISPEFSRMSLKPGIGSKWFDSFKEDVYPHDYVVVNGHKGKPPRFYDKLLKKEDPTAAEFVAFDRYERSAGGLEDTTPDRLEVRRVVTEARLKFKKRTL